MLNMRESWTDERLDDFVVHVDRRFEEVYRRFDEVDRRFESLERRMETGFEQVQGELHRVNDRLDGMYRLMIYTSVGILGAFTAALAGLLATQI
jgi:hypothetical protein